MGRQLTDAPITILFTDVEGSTALHAAKGDRDAQAILRASDDLVRQLVRTHGGRAVKSLGDGLMVTFTSPRKAIACALAIQSTVERVTGRDPDLSGVRIRIGLHTGEATEQGGDLHGAAVHAAARICAKAKGGEILVSDVVRQLCGAVSETSFEDRGRLALRGFPERWRLYRVTGTSSARGATASDDGGLAGLFVGRQRELAELRLDLNRASAGEPRFVLVAGEPGIGKSALLRRFLADVAEARVLRATGDQSEVLLPFGVVEQLARSASAPLPEELAGLSRRSARSPEPVDVGVGFLDLLSTVQETGPVLVVLDDAQWADGPSMSALLFALRRLQADRVLTLIAVREEGMARLPEGLLKLVAGERGASLRLDGLGASELQELGESVTGGAVPRGLAEHLREHTGGSPLHTRALLEELPLEALRRPGDVPLPSPRSFSTQVLGRLAGCTPDAQHLAIAAAVLGMQCSLAVARRLAQVEDPLGALEQAISARLLEARDEEDGYGVAFPHALVRAAIYHDIGPSRRAELHLRAAELVEDEAVSLQHRSAAAFEDDEVLAGDLADYARREAACGAWARAAAALLRAGRLSPARPQRELRILEGVECLLVAGETGRAASLTEELCAFADGPHRRYVQGRLALYCGRTDEGEELLKSAWDVCDVAQDRQLAAKIAVEVTTVLIRRARGDEMVLWSRRALAAAEGTPLARAPLAFFGVGLVYAGRPAEGLAAYDLLPDSSRDLEAEDVYAFAGRGGVRFTTDDLPGAHADFSAVTSAATRWGPFFFRAAGLAYLSATEYRLGAWDDAIVHAELGASLGEEQVLNLTSFLHSAAAAPLAGRGDWESARAHADASVRAISNEAGLADATTAQALISAARGDHPAVIEALRPIQDMSAREGIDEPGTRWPWRELCADALVSLGRLDEAEAMLAPAEELAAARERHSALANTARVRGNLEGARKRTAAAEAAFLAAVGHSEKVLIPFDRARLDAAYGRFLRRAGRRTAAVSQLRAARERFAQLGARPYVDACDQELAASGIAPTKRRDRDRARLTPQELSVARLVARGLTNREVASQLVVSLNTVEYHLKNVYGKLGVTSRSQLILQLDRPTAAEGSLPPHR